MPQLTEILKNAPKGLELYATTIGLCKLKGVSDNWIYIVPVGQTDNEFDIMENGQIYTLGECVLWPSKDNKSWDAWQRDLIPRSIGCAYNTNGTLYLVSNKYTAFKLTKDSFERHYIGNTINDSTRYATPEECEEFLAMCVGRGFKLIEKTSDGTPVCDLVKKDSAKVAEGDWIAYKFNCKWHTAKIKEIDIFNRQYVFTDGEIMTFDNADASTLTKWDIDKAEAGDILVSADGKPFIYNGKISEQRTTVGAFCGIAYRDVFMVATSEDCWSDDIEDIRPADDAAKNILFVNMANYGYKWDANTLTLEKRFDAECEKLWTNRVESSGEEQPKGVYVADRNYMEGMIVLKGLDTIQYNTIFSIVKTWQKE